MSARLNKQAPQGEAPQTARTDQSFIAGVGLAGAAAATVVLGLIIGLGTASFQVWPEAPQLPGGSAVELAVPTEVAVELPSTGLLASTAPLDFAQGAPIGASPPAGGGNGSNGSNGSNGPGGGADGSLGPGQGSAPGATAPAGDGGDLGTAGEDVEPGGGEGSPPADPGNSGGKGGNGHGNGPKGGSGGGKGKGKGKAADSTSTTTTTTTGGRKPKHGKVEPGRGAR